MASGNAESEQVRDGPTSPSLRWMLLSAVLTSIATELGSGAAARQDGWTTCSSTRAREGVSSKPPRVHAPHGAGALRLSTGRRSGDRRADVIAGLPDWLMPIVSIIAAQLFTHLVAGPVHAYRRK